MNANVDSNSDLFKALKGGLNNFGVVTRFDLKTFPQGKMWGGFVFYEPNTTAMQLQALQSFTDASAAGVDDYAAIESIHSYVFAPARSNFSIGIFAYTKPVAYPKIFENLTSIKPQVASDLRVTNLTNLTIEAGDGTWTNPLTNGSSLILTAFRGIPNGGRYDTVFFPKHGTS